jgi:hypothetical protein
MKTEKTYLVFWSRILIPTQKCRPKNHCTLENREKKYQPMSVQGKGGKKKEKNVKEKGEKTKDKGKIEVRRVK